jgi:putative hydrolase of the HAD superfamily
MHDLWEASLPVEPYPWTVPVLEELAGRELPVVLLSDAWPSLRRFYRELGLDGYLKGLVISAEEGVTSPDSRMYTKSLELLAMKPAHVVFVDDWPENVHAAVSLGIRGIRLCHEDAESDPTTEEITDLRGLLALV